jgi:Zn-dependent peptidase ImmA (M78 family)/transcriptional regulator with XRE-family HTH domain
MFEKNLRFYRLKNGLSKKALAQACSVTPMAITYYEAGERKPSMEVLEALAAALNVRLADLLKRRNSKLVFEHGGFRKNAALGKSDQDFIRESVEEYFGRFYDVIEVLGGEVLPDAPECGCLELTGSVETDAAALRGHLKIDPVGPVHDLVEILENRGILVMVLASDNEAFGGMNGFVDGRPYVVVNGKMSPERNRSTIVHELAHLMFRWPDDVQGKDQEDRATAIGGAFLLPADDAKRELGLRRSAVTNDMTLVAKEYGVSMILLAKRANLVGILGDSAYKTFCSAAAKNGWRRSEPSRILPEQPMLFDQLVYRAVCEDDISIQRGAELLGACYEAVVLECAPCGA